MVNLYFSDFFGVDPEDLEEYGALDVSLVNDLPLFVDPFLLFNSGIPEYRKLHEDIISYIRFLRDKSISGPIGEGLLRAWYMFGEVKQNWLGYSKVGNAGSGLGKDFAYALNANLNSIFTDFGNEKVARGSHLEKLSLVSGGVGRDNISDFSANLIKEFLLEYTQSFARDKISPEKRKVVPVSRARFNYDTETWETRRYDLPWIGDDFVLLTPKDILTKDDMWISRADLIDSFDDIVEAVSNEQLREQLNNYIISQLPREPKAKDYGRAFQAAIVKYPAVLEYYIRQKEDRGGEAVYASSKKVAQTQKLFIVQAGEFVEKLAAETEFYAPFGGTYEEAKSRVNFLKDVIENKDGYRIFYVAGQPIKREDDLQILFRLTWYASPSDVNREVNNGRGPVDFKISRGSKDKTLVEFKLASNTHLRRNLERQVSIYEKASDARKSFKVILFFSEEEMRRVATILNDLRLADDETIVLIDARSDNKPSASKA